jgi:hypothetical protein
MITIYRKTVGQAKEGSCHDSSWNRMWWRGTAYFSIQCGDWEGDVERLVLRSIYSVDLR